MKATPFVTMGALTVVAALALDVTPAQQSGTRRKELLRQDLGVAGREVI